MGNFSVTDNFIGNLVVSWLITCCLVIGIDHFAMDLAWLRGASPRVEILFMVAIAICVLFVAPYIYKRARRIQPSIFEDGDCRKAAWRGRLIGLGVGLVSGITIQGM
ncbi:hypothetical protein [Burkholderia sp. BCC1988]|uniref:hypothetical protein n=1 Tax=Burkholderia sp. BCC1988 TaxID=2817443 RepID=UPI002AB071CD|nr:hypothetical protein [Burkholderia sp. BCC1988]